MVLLGDEEDNLPLRENLRKRLIEQAKRTKNGKRGEAFEGVISRLGLN